MMSSTVQMSGTGSIASAASLDNSVSDLRSTTIGSTAVETIQTAAATAVTAKTNFTFSSVRSLHRFNELEKYFEIQRVENEAARVIQIAWRRTRVLLPWRHAVLCLKMVQRIQRVARGVMTRKWVARWFNKRNTVVVAWQARTRRYLSNLHLQPQLLLEWKMTIRIQSLVRGFIARKKYYMKLRNLMATRIQVLWRGVVGRLRTDKLWLNTTVIPIQSLYRKRMAVKRHHTVLAEAKAAAIIIQKCFRNWASRQRVGDRLFDREMGYRSQIIKMLTSEEEYLTERLERSMLRLVKSDNKGKAERAFKVMKDLEASIYLKENDLIEMRRQQDIISPRARAQGYDEELAKNVMELRSELTDMKIKHLFDLQVKVHKQDELFESQVVELEELSMQRDQVALFRNQEYEDRRHMTYKREITQRRKERRQAVADEKRKWRVLYYTSDGKPDKKRRPGMPWDPSLYAGPDKDIYSAGVGVNLLANVNPSTGGDGTVESVDRTLSQVNLQTYLDQVRVYEQLLQPIENVMKETMGGMGSMLPTAAISGGDAVAASATGSRPGTANSVHVLRSRAPQDPPRDLSQRGFGPIGAEIIPALQTIGALPADEIIEEQRNTELLMQKPGSAPKIRGIDGKLIASPRKSRQRQKGKLDPLQRHDGGVVRESQSSRDFRSDDQFGDEVVVLEPPPPTASEIFAAYRRKKKATKRSYLPALNAFTMHEKPKIRPTLSVADSKVAASVMDGINNDDDGAQSVISDMDHSTGSQHSSIGSKKRRVSILSASQGSERMQRQGDVREQEEAAAAAAEQQSQALVLKADKMMQVTTTRAQRVAARTAAAEAARLKQLQEDRAARASAMLFNAGIVVDGKAGQFDDEMEPEYWRDINHTVKKREEERNQSLFETRRKAKKGNRRTATIPWELLDQVDGARKRFEAEKAYVEFNKKF